MRAVVWKGSHELYQRADGYTQVLLTPGMKAA
jgi:predicted RNA binding protein YcfA (HicA-like mRNA interferase family)